MWISLFETYKNISDNNINDLKELLRKYKGELFQVPYNETVILLFSGGMDSVILLDLIIRRWKCKVILIYFERNSKNQIWEKKSVIYFYNFYKNKFPNYLLELIFLSIEIPLRINKEYLNRNRQEIFGLPMRNNIMWSNAFTQAIYLSGKYKDTIRTIIVGSVGEDIITNESGVFSIFAYNLNLCSSLGILYYQLLAPFIDGSFGNVFYKKDLINYSNENNIPLEKSRSCFGSSEEPCNECLACKNRIKAYNRIVL